MKLKNLILFIPSAFLSTLIKTVRLNMTDEINKEAVKQGLYHCVPNEEVGQKILKSGKIKATRNVINAYGTPASFMFLGVPELENYMKNLMTDLSADNNIILNPSKIIYAVKMNPKLEELSNYRSRMTDGAIVHEGDCIIPEERTKLTQLVLDLQRDENGQVILDENGFKKIGLRERTEEEIQSGEPYTPSEEFLEALESYKQRNGYFKNDILGIGNSANTIVHLAAMEGKYTLRNTLKEISKTIKRFLHPQKKLIENENQKVHRVTKEIEQGQIETKKSVRDRKYVDSIIQLKQEGIKQQGLSTALPEFLQSREAEYLKSKLESLSDKPIYKSKLHGISHSDRVATLALMIAKNEGLNLDDRMLDILATAGFYHDIGRVFDIGPHAKRSSRLLSKMSLVHLNGEKYSPEDMKILRAIVDAHEGTEKKASKMPEKYKVDSKDMPITSTLISIIRDADALDRARLSSKDSMDLNPKYLRTKSAKGLIDFSFQFEALTRKVPDFKSVLSYDRNKEMQEESQIIDPDRQKFIEELREGVDIDQNTHLPEVGDTKEPITEEKDVNEHIAEEKDESDDMEIGD